MTTIRLRRDTAANWTAINPTLALGEPGVETDTGKIKIGTGAATWTALAYFAGSGGGAVTSVNTRTGAVVGLAEQTAVDAKAPLASPTFTGTPAAPTPSAGTTTTALATTAYVQHHGTRVRNLKGSNSRLFRTALAKARAGTGLCSILGIGDSTTAGIFGASSPGYQYITSYPARLRELLVAQAAPVTGALGGPAGTDNRWTNTAGAGWASGGQWLWLAAAPGAGTTFVSDRAGTVVSVRYPLATVANTGQFSVAIDGGGAVTVTPAVGVGVGVYEVTGLANTTHTVVLTGVSNPAYIYSVTVRAASGVILFNWGGGGTVSGDWLTSGSATYLGAVYGSAPHLTVLNLGINDCGTPPSVAPATFAANMATIVAGLKAQGSDVLLVVPNPQSTATARTAYDQALHDLAVSADVPWIDITERWGSWATANTNGMMIDTVHPTLVGYWDMGTAIFGAIAEMASL